MVIWRGWGVLVLIEFAIVFAVIRELGFEEPVSGLASGAVAALAIWFTGRWFNNPAKDRVVVDAQTGAAMRLVSRHSLFWIPMQWWALPVALFGIFVAFGKL